MRVKPFPNNCVCRNYLQKLNFVPYFLTQVVRNSQPITEVARNLYKSDVALPVSSVKGDPIKWHLLSTPFALRSAWLSTSGNKEADWNEHRLEEQKREEVRLLRDVVTHLLQNCNVFAHDVAVLVAGDCTVDYVTQAVKSIQHDLHIVSAAGKTSRGLVVDTAAAFQSLDRRVVVLFHPDIPQFDHGHELYIGFTRAVARLHVICKPDTQECVKSQLEAYKQFLSPDEGKGDKRASYTGRKRKDRDGEIKSDEDAADGGGAAADESTFAMDTDSADDGSDGGAASAPQPQKKKRRKPPKIKEEDADFDFSVTDLFGNEDV